MKTKEQIFYKKVYIHSEDDLPKETGRYWGHEKYVKSQDLLDSYHYDKDDKDFCCDWLNTFDWYLLPVSLPSDEEIEAEIHKQCTFRAGDEEYTNSLNERERIIGAKWMRDKLTAK